MTDKQEPGPDYEPLRVPPSAIALEAADALASKDAEIAALREQVKAMREALEAQKTPRCAECSGDGVVSRSWGYIPCEACNGKGF